MVGPGQFVVEDGMLKTEGGMGLLCYKGQKFGNTTIRVVFKTASPKANSGVYIRLPEAPKDPWYGVHNGYEVQIDAGGDEWHCTGAIYSLSKVSQRNQKPAGEWNTMDITFKGNETIVQLNGQGGERVPRRPARAAAQAVVSSRSAARAPMSATSACRTTTNGRRSTSRKWPSWRSRKTCSAHCSIALFPHPCTAAAPHIRLCRRSTQNCGAAGVPVRRFGFSREPSQCSMPVYGSGSLLR